MIEKKKNKLPPGKAVYYALSILIILCLCLCFAEYFRYLGALRAYGKIEYIELGQYELSPFSSELISQESINERQALDALDKSLRSGKIMFYDPGECHFAAIIHFENSGSAVVYITPKGIGLDYGRIWLRQDTLQNFFTLSSE